VQVFVVQVHEAAFSNIKEKRPKHHNSIKHKPGLFYKVSAVDYPGSS
jgi:hypothetical protein